MIIKKNKKVCFTTTSCLKTEKDASDWYYDGSSKIYGSKYKSVSLRTDKLLFRLNRNKYSTGTTLEDV